MAKLIINIGEEANDGTGDPIRSAMSKTNANFTELYDNIGDLTLLDLGITDGEDGQVLTANGDGTFSFAAGGSGGGSAYVDADVDVHLNTSTAADDQILSWTGSDYDWIDAPSGGGSYGNSDVDAHLNNSSIASGKILGWNGSDYAWVDQAGSGSSYTDSDAISAITGADLDMAGRKVLFGNVYSTEGDLPDAGSYHGMFAHVHGTGAGYFAHSGTWVRLANQSEVSGGGGSLPSRSDKAGVTASIADNVSTDIDITGFKGYGLYTITTSAAAWVTLYTDNSSRSADNSRAETTDPAPDAGIVAEVITTGAQTVKLSPGTIGYNLESSPTTNIPVKVRNRSGGTTAITVTLNVLQLEA
jgi:hypothetical protein